MGDVFILKVMNHFTLHLPFEHASFAINGKYSKENYNNPNYYASIVIF
jgi:hypothetical protein